MKIILSLLLAVATLSTSRAQECLGFTLKAGSNYEMTSFNAKDKPTGKITYQIKNVRKEGAATIMDVVAQFQDESGRQQNPYTIHYTCTGNELVADMSGMMQGMQNAGMKDAEMRLKTNRLAYPGKYDVGQKLSDGQMEAELFTNGSRMMEMNMLMSNRQVESKSPITTPAGTFDTYKVSSDMSYESRVMGIPIRNSGRVVSYRAESQLFDVRSETYNKNGKLMGYMLLSKAN